MEVGQTAAATQNGLSAALSDADISVKNEAVVSVTMTVSKKASWNSSWWGSWRGNYGNGSCSNCGE